MDNIFTSDNLVYFIWLGLIILFLIIEAVSMELITVWAAFGSVFALVTSLIWPEAYILQIFVFVIVSSLCVIFVRSIAIRFLKVKEVKTNVDEFIGKRGVVTQGIKEFDFGEVKVNGVLWTAAIADLEKNSTIEANSIVEVSKVEGSKLYVNLVHKKTN